MKRELEAVWVTQEGEVMRFEDMSTSHLFFSIRMIYNHTAPPALQIHGCRRYHFDWPAEMRRLGLKLLIAELAKRPKNELKPWQWAQLAFMANCVKDFQILKLPQRASL